MSARYGYDITNGQEVAPLVIKQDHVMRGTHMGSTHVEAGHFDMQGRNQGSLDIQSGVKARISGSQQGSVYIAPDAEVIVTGAMQGSVHVDVDAILIIEEGAKLAGSLTNHGTVIVRGVYGGSQSGNGEFKLEGNGCVKQPIVRDGANYYNW